MMCVDYDTDTRHGVCGSPLDTLETFTVNQVALVLNQAGI